MHHTKKGTFLTASPQPFPKKQHSNFTVILSWHALQELAHGDFQGERTALIIMQDAVVGKGGLHGLRSYAIESLPQM